MALMWNRTVDWDADDWRRVAACRNTEPDLFFPVGTTGPAVDQIEAAKRVCRSCEALEPCLDFALGHQPGVRRLGWHLRGGAAQAAQGLAGGPPVAARRFLNLIRARAALTGAPARAPRSRPASRRRCASASASMEMVPSS